MAELNRPLSPHLQIWRWGIHMFMSIAHRGTGMINTVGSLMLIWGVVAVASGPQAYETFMGFAGSLIGRFVLFGFTLSLFWHMGSGIRHLFMDAGHLYDLRANKASARVVIGVAVVLTLATWIAGYIVTGGI